MSGPSDPPHREDPGQTGPDRSLRTGLAALVYAGAATLAGTALVPVPTPTSPPVVVLGLAALVLAGHAARSGHLDALGHAVVWMWVALLALSVVTGIMGVLVLDRPGLVPLVASPPARTVGTAGLWAVLLAGYRRRIQDGARGHTRGTL